jgi:prophage regulatory protein
MKDHETSRADTVREKDEEMTRILRERDVKHLTGLSRVTRWRLEKVDRFPHRVQLTQRCVGWPESEVLEWLNERVQARESQLISPSAPAKKSGAR